MDKVKNCDNCFYGADEECTSDCFCTNLLFWKAKEVHKSDKALLNSEKSCFDCFNYYKEDTAEVYCNKCVDKVFWKKKEVQQSEVVLDASGSVRQEIDTVCKELSEFLKEKNRKYGNAALEPFNVFSKSTAEEKINVRLDDKLARIKNRQNDEDEDVLWDLIGYLILKCVYRRINKEK